LSSRDRAFRDCSEAHEDRGALGASGRAVIRTLGRRRKFSHKTQNCACNYFANGYDYSKLGPSRRLREQGQALLAKDGRLKGVVGASRDSGRCGTALARSVGLARSCFGGEVPVDFRSQPDDRHGIRP
jgi:hypothetical protein